jgi:hypothetical protein
VDSDVAETVAVVALPKASLGLIRFYFEDNVRNVGMGEDCLWRLAALQRLKK